MKDTRFTLDQRLSKVSSTSIVDGGNKYCDMRQIDLWSIQKWSDKYIKGHSNMSRNKRTDALKSINI